MASNTVRNPLFRAVSNRTLAAQAATKTSQRPQSSEAKTTVLPNKLVVASVDSHSPISTVSILFRAGSRFEHQDSLGTTHALRIAAGLTTKDSSNFGIVRNLQKIGATLSCQSDRESIAYTLESTVNNLDTGLKYLEDVATKQIFKPWELAENIPRFKYEVEALSPIAKLTDLLHKAAYRTGLGNGLFCPNYLVGSHNSESLQHYVRSLFTTNRAAVVGVGVDHDELICFAQNLSLESGAGPTDIASKYFGGDQRLDTASGLAHVAVAMEGASLKNTKEALAFAVLQYAFGVGPSVKWGASAGPLNKSAATAAGNEPFAVSALNASYSDSGLFGIVVSAPANVAGSVVSAAAKKLRSGNVSSADINRGKAQLKSAILFSQESISCVNEDIGSQALLLGCVQSAPAIAAAAVDSISDSDVNAAASKLKSGKVSVAAIGNLSTVPYSDQL